MVPLNLRQPQPSSSQQNSVPSLPQMGMNNNSQIPNPFNGVAMSMPNMMANSMTNQPNFMNVPNNHMGMAQFPHPVRPHMGFSQQCNGNNVNPMALPFPNHGFGHNNNVLNLPQFNPNGTGLPFGQLCLPNAMQGMNQFASMQMPPNLSQFVPQNVFGPQVQNPGFVANPQFGNMHFNQIMHQLNQVHSLLRPCMDANGINPPPMGAQQLGPSSSASISNSKQMEQANKNFQSFEAQGNPSGTDGFNGSRGGWKNQSNKNFTRNPKAGMQQGGSQNSQFHQMKNGRKNSRFPNGRNGRGMNNEKPAKFGMGNSKNEGREQKRSTALTYTEQEIQQWRQERKKNYPSKNNIQKKLAEKMQNKEGVEKEAKLRQEQLKEILAKQAELGVEVAEIPGCHISDTKKSWQQRGENGRQFNKNGRFKNKFEKRGRYDKKDRHSKKPRLNENAPSNVPFTRTRKPTLLEKLLLPDIKRENIHLLQALRFMVLNNFFDGSSDEPLKFPTVVLKDGSGEDISAGEVNPNEGKDVSVGSDEDKERRNKANDSDSDSDSDDHERQEDENEDEEVGEEEGEIII